MRKSKTKKCRKCGKTFTAVLQWAEYCSSQCEILASNPVAKYNYHRASQHRPKKGKGSFRRQNKVRWNLETEA